MKAIVQDRYGSADVLELRDVEEPVVGDDDVLVRVHAAGGRPGRVARHDGPPYFARPHARVPHDRRPRVRAGTSRGRSRRSARRSRGFRPGDEVMGIADGSFAELAVAPADKLVPQARAAHVRAGRRGSDLRAHRPPGACATSAKVQPGQRVLVIGAGGGVGTLAVQIAKAMGAEVTGVCSTAKLDLVRSIGADDVIDYTREEFTDGSRRWDVIVDTAGRRPLRQLRRALTPRGTLVIVGGDGGGRWTGGFFRGMLRAPRSRSSSARSSAG